MKFKIFFLLFLILSCSPHYTKLDNKKAYIATGLALIYDENDYKNMKHYLHSGGSEASY